MLILLVGALVAFVFDLVALVLAIVSLASRKRATLALPALALSLAAIVFNVFDWLTILRGHGSRGEPLVWSEDWPFYAIAAGQACVVVLAIVGSVGAFRGGSIDRRR
jgi:hypothetical protein